MHVGGCPRPRRPQLQPPPRAPPRPAPPAALQLLLMHAWADSPLVGWEPVKFRKTRATDQLKWKLRRSPGQCSRSRAASMPKVWVCHMSWAHACGLRRVRDGAQCVACCAWGQSASSAPLVKGCCVCEVRLCLLAGRVHLLLVLHLLLVQHLLLAVLHAPHLRVLPLLQQRAAASQRRLTLRPTRLVKPKRVPKRRTPTTPICNIKHILSRLWRWWWWWRRRRWWWWWWCWW